MRYWDIMKLLYLFSSSCLLPSPRIMFSVFQHGATVVQDKMYIFGGNHNGRYLNDLHVSKSLTSTEIGHISI